MYRKKTRRERCRDYLLQQPRKLAEYLTMDVLTIFVLLIALVAYCI